jgi:hypothetical protein
MIHRTLARLTVASLVTLALVACQDTESPLAPLPRALAPRLSIDPAAQIDQQNLETDTHAGATASMYGQSFTAGISGRLTTISVLVSCKRGVVPDGVLEVYKGKYDFSTIYTNPAAIASQPVPTSVWPTPCTFPETDTWLDFTFDTPASIVAGQVYTFHFAGLTDQAAIVHPMHSSNPYAGGSAFGYSGFDLVFKTFVLAGAAPDDATPPVITPVVTGTLGNNGWYRTNVNVSWTVVDTESDTSASSGCGSTSVTTDNAGVTFTCSAASGGGTASQSVTIRRDANGPALDASVSPVSVVLNGSATASPGATDDFSGVASSSCAAVVTSSIGAKSVACTATDNAGNVTLGNASYNVIWPFTGFTGGVDAYPTLNSTKAGTSVQLKFTLGGNRGLAIFAAGSPTSQGIACSGKPITLGDPIATGGTGPTYDTKSGQYAYAWKTEKAWAGTCRKLSVMLVDGTEHVAVFQFTK